MTDASWQGRARDELQAAQRLIELGHADAATSRAYYAAFYAAKAALESLGTDKSTHSAVVSSFGQLVVKQGGGNPAAGRALNRLYDSRIRADYTLDPMSETEARSAFDRAKTVVDAVESWLADER